MSVDLEHGAFRLPVIFKKSLGQGMWVQGSIAETATGLYAKEYFHAPKHGDEAMGLFQDELHAIARRMKRPITHVYTAANSGSLALIQRASGYTCVGEDSDGNQVFEKVFTP